jgi:hypothetical protein
VSGGGDGAGMVADPKGVYIGLVASGAADSKSEPKKENAMFITKDEVTIKAAESLWSLAKNGNLTGQAKSAVDVKAGKGISFKADGAVVVNAGKAMSLIADKDVKINPSGNCVVKGTKVLLG